MNHLHEWLEWETTLAMVPAVREVAKNAMCFSMPDMSVCPRVEQRPELLRLPYASCWIEGRGRTETHDGIVAMICHQKADGFVAIAYTRTTVQSAKRWFPYGGFGWNVESGWVYQPELRPTIQLAEAYAEWLGSFLNLINCVNVAREEHHPSDQLQKARAKRGKLALYSYWTLNLNLDTSERSESLGGTHASPRLHLRRGHTRQHHPGRWCWVNPHAVGNKKLGVVHKDYAIRAAEVAL